MARDKGDRSNTKICCSWSFPKLMLLRSQNHHAAWDTTVPQLRGTMQQRDWPGSRGLGQAGHSQWPPKHCMCLQRQTGSQAGKGFHQPPSNTFFKIIICLSFGFLAQCASPAGAWRTRALSTLMVPHQVASEKAQRWKGWGCTWASPTMQQWHLLKSEQAREAACRCQLSLPTLISPTAAGTMIILPCRELRAHLHKGTGGC